MLDLTVTVSIVGEHFRPRGLGRVDYDLNYVKTKRFLSGLGVDQADLVYQAGDYPDVPGRLLAAGASENLDFSGILVDAIGDVLVPAKVKVFYLYGWPTNQGALEVGGGANPWIGFLGGGTQAFTLPPDGVVLHTNPGLGWPVVNATGDILKVMNPGPGPASYDIIVVFASPAPP